jgi:DNA-binding transcriptional ArsR family regulator
VPDEFITTLIGGLRDRLDELEAEKGAIKRALRVLEPHKSRGRRRDLQTLLIESIKAFPGSRASFLALEFGISPATAVRQLRALEQSGLVEKRGLGWALTGRGEASRLSPPTQSG